MERQELLGLLNTMTPMEDQRITAEIPVVRVPVSRVERFIAATELSPNMIVLVTGGIVSLCVGALIAIL
jgi:hypothetical protein